MIPIGETADGRADMTNFEMDLFDTRMTYITSKDDDDTCCARSCIKPACVPISIIALFIFMAVFFPLLNDDVLDATKKYERTGICRDACRLDIVESIPSNLTYPALTTMHNSTYDAWMRLIAAAKESIDIASYYWNLRDDTRYVTSWQFDPCPNFNVMNFQGQNIFNALVSAARDRHIAIRIVQNIADEQFPQNDSSFLQLKGLASVRSLNFTHFLGSGILHTKFWIIDAKHVYIGSANMDWKSLTEVKELGVTVTNCVCIANDLDKIFSVYWKLGEIDARIPTKWPLAWRTAFNQHRPLNIQLNTIASHVYISSSPLPLNPRGRENDISAIVRTIDDAVEYVHVAVMDYLPTTLYMAYGNRYWPSIDDALRSAAYRGVHVRMLVSDWKSTRTEQSIYLRSLRDINPALPRHLIHNSTTLRRGTIEIKLFRVPSTHAQSRISFARVNHNKYMLTENTAYIGTSNWVGDYFLTTAGVGLVIRSNTSDIKQSSIIGQFHEIFLRDWNSVYAHSLL